LELSVKDKFEKRQLLQLIKASVGKETLRGILALDGLTQD